MKIDESARANEEELCIYNFVVTNYIELELTNYIEFATEIPSCLTVR